VLRERERLKGSGDVVLLVKRSVQPRVDPARGKREGPREDGPAKGRHQLDDEGRSALRGGGSRRKATYRLARLPGGGEAQVAETSHGSSKHGSRTPRNEHAACGPVSGLLLCRIEQLPTNDGIAIAME
jgi:hypothetical protein